MHGRALPLAIHQLCEEAHATPAAGRRPAVGGVVGARGVPARPGRGVQHTRVWEARRTCGRKSLAARRS
jgi:hypothetical protein